MLVGNGPSLLKWAKGPEIDAFDEVVRFNRFRIRGFEPFTGVRTTLWSTFGHGYLPGDDDQRPKRMIFVYGERGEPAYKPEDIYRIPRTFYKQCHERILARTKRPEHIGMTSGYLVALWLLEIVGLPVVTLAGFDHFRKNVSRQHHYYNAKHYAAPSEHDGEAEAAILSETTKVRYL